MPTKYPSGARFLAPGSKPLPKSYFDNMKGDGKKNVKVVKKPALGKTLQGGKSGMPKVPSVQADTMHGNLSDEDKVNQGLLKGVKLRNLKTKSGTNRMQR